MTFLLLCILTWSISYLIGGIPTGFIVARIAGIPDIRKHGSGNIGATNVGRTLGFVFFCLILCLDAGKAFLNIWLLKTYSIGLLQTYNSDISTMIYIAAFMHLVGNAYSPFLRFTGGKGGATATGLMLALQPMIVPIVFAVWVCLVFLGRNVGIATVCSALLFPYFVYVFNRYSPSLLLLNICIAVWIIMRHHTNIKQWYCSRSR